jgi:DNA-binding transcriptional ArsR family regulator
VTVRNATKTTDGNASVHLRKLEDAGYVLVGKRVVARRPQRLYRLTSRGALLDYLGGAIATFALPVNRASEQTR